VTEEDKNLQEDDWTPSWEPEPPTPEEIEQEKIEEELNEKRHAVKVDIAVKISNVAFHELGKFFEEHYEIMEYIDTIDVIVGVIQNTVRLQMEQVAMLESPVLFKAFKTKCILASLEMIKSFYKINLDDVEIDEEEKAHLMELVGKAEAYQIEQNKKHGVLCSTKGCAVPTAKGDKYCATCLSKIIK
jgi:hypothetical protein